MLDNVFHSQQLIQNADMEESCSEIDVTTSIPGNDDSNGNEATQCILPGLPNAVALYCLARVPRRYYQALKAVSRCWKRALSCSEILTVRKELRCTEACIFLSFVRRSIQTNCVKNWLEAYDPSLNVWRPVCWLPGLNHTQMLKGFGCVGLNGKVYVIGGRLCTRTYPNSNSNSKFETEVTVKRDVYCYDCLANTWTKCASMLIPRVDFAYTVCNGHIYVAGEISQAGDVKGMDNAEVYVPTEDRWIALPRMSTGRFKCFGVAINSKFYVIGGFTNSWDSNNSSNNNNNAFAWSRSSVDVYDPVNNRWEFVKCMWQLDVPPYQVVNLDGRLYSCGDLLNSWKGCVEFYDEELNMWKGVEGSRRRLGEELVEQDERRYLTMAAVGKRLYFLAGYCNVRQKGRPMCQHVVEIFHASTGDWEFLVGPVDEIACREISSHCCVLDF